MKFRRSLYIVEDMKRGDRFSPENVRAIRPGFGISPESYDLIMGKTVNSDVSRGTPVSWDLVG